MSKGRVQSKKKKCGNFHIRGVGIRKQLFTFFLTCVKWSNVEISTFFFFTFFPNPLVISHLVVRSAEAWQEPPLVTQVDLVEKLL